ncbi:ras-related protein Rab-20-like [Anneissia japonica]|uniref:ras-related protein Rab-20-like n=1 Tax=Anneissia japonica TaxID=1529436 RepID=UPI001425528F|nr:ras-related protein Rab-20-like [Anneissia japonica]
MAAPQSGSGKKKADVKVVIVGEAFVGKTTLVKRYMDGQFTHNVGTIGACFSLKQWGQYNIAIWDTAGEERFSGLSSFYCRDASAAILAYDIGNKKTFEMLEKRFLPLLDAAKEDCLFCVTGTKLDLVKNLSDSATNGHDAGSKTIENKKNARQVTQQEAVEFAMQINEPRFKNKKPETRPFFETSSLTGENVCDVFEYIFQELLPIGEDRMTTRGSKQVKDKNVISVDNEPTTERKKPCC